MIDCFKQDEDSEELCLPADIRDCSPDSVHLILNAACDSDCICGKNSHQENHSSGEQALLEGKQPVHLGRECEVLEKNGNRHIVDTQAHKMAPCSNLEKLCNRVLNVSDGKVKSRMKFDCIKPRICEDSDRVEVGVRNGKGSFTGSDVLVKKSRNKILHKGRSNMAENARRLVSEFMSDCPTTLNLNSLEFGRCNPYKLINLP